MTEDPGRTIPNGPTEQDAVDAIPAAPEPAAATAEPAPGEADVTAPAEAAEPAGPGVSALPAEPAEAGETAESAEPTEPAEAVESAEAAEAAELAETVEPTEAAEPAALTEAAEPAEPVEPAEAAEPAEVAEPAAPTEAAEPAEAVEPAEAAEAVEPAAGSGEQESAAIAGSPAQAKHRPAGHRPGGGKPGQPGRGRPGAPRPGAAHPATPTVEPVIEPVDPHRWGRIDEAGVVYVYSTTGERPVGNWQAGDVEAGLAHFGRRFDDFITEIALLETRLATGSGDPKAAKAHAIELRDSVDKLAAIGDFDSAAARLEVVIGAADTAISGASQARAAARARAVAAKEALCVEAEQLATSTAWKVTGDRLKAIVEEWRTIHGIDRKTDDALWKRFAKARDTFTRHRGTHFADLDKQRAAAKDVKEALISRAEALSDSTEWGRTAGDYRTLMEEWKASGRAPRDVEDELWGRFRAAQERFFSRRNHTFTERDAEFEANATAKEHLLAEAETIDPANLDAARAKLRSIQERWEAAGKVPRERIREFDSRLRAVEERVQKAADSHWRRTDPETTARVAQFRSRVEAYQAQAAKARAAGNERKAKEAEAQAAQWQEWLNAAESAVE